MVASVTARWDGIANAIPAHQQQSMGLSPMPYANARARCGGQAYNAIFAGENSRSDGGEKLICQGGCGLLPIEYALAANH